MSAGLDDLAQRLSSIAEDIADLALDSIREEIRSGGTKRPAVERQLTQARRSVEKAVHILRRLDSDTPVDSDPA